MTALRDYFHPTSVRLEYEVRVFALGARNDLQRQRVLEQLPKTGAAKTEYARERLVKRLGLIESGDKAEWLWLLKKWGSLNQAIWSEYAGDADEYKSALEWDKPEAYAMFRKKIEQHAGIPPESMVFFCERGGESWREASIDLHQRAMRLLSERQWRTYRAGTLDVYALLLGPSESLDIVWLDCGWLDITNRGRDVAHGPEIWRISKPKAA